MLDKRCPVVSICGTSRMVFDLVGPVELDAMVVFIHIGVGRRLPAIVSTQIESKPRIQELYFPDWFTVPL
jgi:hypothetical protein